MIRRAVTALMTVLTAMAGPSLAAPAGHQPAQAGTYAMPVPGRMVRGFEPPRTRYGAGHRGVDLATAAGETVHADGAGTVTFAGRVAGRGIVVIAHPDGVRTEVEPVDALVKVGATVVLGGVIATVDGRHDTCAPGGCLHWSARRDDQYFDPLTLLSPLGPVRLLPWSGPRFTR